MKAAEKAIFLCTDREPVEGEHEHVWYQLRFRSTKKKKNSRPKYVLTSVDRAPPSLPQVKDRESTFVSLGAVVYVLGGRPNIHGSVVSCDTSSSDMRWTQCPSMLCPRTRLAAATLLGKIYVFGGCPPTYLPRQPSDHDDLFGEVFDPERQTWEPLPDPPEKLGGSYSTAGVCVNGKNLILVHSVPQQELYAYDVDDKSWMVMDYYYGAFRQGMVVLDGVLYNMGGGKLCAYDLVRKKSLSVQNRGQNLVRHRRRATLHDIGNGMLGVAHFGGVFLSSNPGAFIYKFRVIKDAPPKSDTHDAHLPTIRVCAESYHLWFLPNGGGRYREGDVSADASE